MLEDVEMKLAGMKNSLQVFITRYIRIRPERLYT